MVKIKICGLTNLDDAKVAAELGVDFVGFVFAPSPRRVEPEQVKAIINGLPRDIQKVGVFADEKIDRIREIAEYCGLDWLQLHGDEPLTDPRRFKQKLIKAIRIKDPSDLDDLNRFPVDALLLDTYNADKLGGTGQVFDWQIARGAAKCTKIFLAGGLDSTNVAEAIRIVRPYAVDVSSGVESAPGQKDINKMRAFIEACREIESVS